MYVLNKNVNSVGDFFVFSLPGLKFLGACNKVGKTDDF
jgi:hypothetical protein